MKAPPSPATVPTRQVLKVGRNDVCPCGSGKKYKSCHLSAGEEWLHQLAYKREKERMKAAQRQAGVPWWKRLFSS
jgi:hypothetical protein